MSATIKQEWVTRLKSGVSQCFQGLKIGDAYTPLGILAEIHNQPTGGAGYISSSLLHPFYQRQLVIMNGVTRKNFLEIAEWIEKNIPDQNPHIYNRTYSPS